MPLMVCKREYGRGVVTSEYAKEFAKTEDEFKQYIDAPFRGNMNTSVIRTVKGHKALKH